MESNYIFERDPDEESKEVDFGALAPEADYIYIFKGADNSITKHKMKKKSPGAGVITVGQHVYIFGGED